MLVEGPIVVPFHSESHRERTVVQVPQNHITRELFREPEESGTIIHGRKLKIVAIQ